MALVSDISDRSIRAAIAYGRHAVKGDKTKHYDRIYGADIYLTAQWSGGLGPWEAYESAFIKANPIAPADFIFHQGLGSDAPDALFSGDDPHPWVSYWAANMPLGVTADDLDSFFGIFKCLRTANYDTQGRQIDAAGNLVPAGADPRSYYFYDEHVNPARVFADQVIRWSAWRMGMPLAELLAKQAQKQLLFNWAAWDAWRQFNEEQIAWDDGRYVPANIVLTPTGGGDLVPGTTYYFRLVGEAAAGVSGAGRVWSVTLPAGASAIQVAWEVQAGAVPPPTGFRIYATNMTPADGGWLGYLHVEDPAARAAVVTTMHLDGGQPPEQAEAGLLRQIDRFQANLFFVPPYGLAAALDKILQVSCADWQWANGKLVLLGPWARPPVFTLNLAETANDFKAWTVDRRQRPNQIQVNYRDLDDPYLDNADPLIIPDPNLADTDPRIVRQKNDGQIVPFVIEGGSMHRSQAERTGTFWYRTLVEMDTRAQLTASPRTYHVLPADPVLVTNDTPGWADIKFKVLRKEENVQAALGDPMQLQVTRDDLYSDTDHAPLERPLPIGRTNPFIEPPAVTDFAVVKYDRHGQRLEWTQVAVAGLSIRGYEIERLDAIAENPPAAVWYRATEVDATSWTDPKMPLATHFRYRIRAVSQFGSPGPWAECAAGVEVYVAGNFPELTGVRATLDALTLTVTPLYGITQELINVTRRTRVDVWYGKVGDVSAANIPIISVAHDGLSDTFIVPIKPSDFSDPYVDARYPGLLFERQVFAQAVYEWTYGSTPGIFIPVFAATTIAPKDLQAQVQPTGTRAYFDDGVFRSVLGSTGGVGGGALGGGGTSNHLALWNTSSNLINSAIVENAAGWTLPGNLAVGNHAAIGSGATVDQWYGPNPAPAILNVRETITTSQQSGKEFGALIWLTAAPTQNYSVGGTPDTIALQAYVSSAAGNPYTFYDLYSFASISQHNGTGTIAGIQSAGTFQTLNTSTATISSQRILNLSSSNGGTINLMMGGNVNPTNAGTISELRGWSIIVSNTGTIGTQYLLRLRTPSGTITAANYGLYIDDQTLGTSPLSENIHSAGVNARNVFEGRLISTRPTANGAPFEVVSTALCANLNADLLDGLDATAFQPADATLTALAGFNSDGILVQTSADTFAARTLAAPAYGLTITNASGTAGNPTFGLANDLAALETLAGTGVAVRTGADAWTIRSFAQPVAGLTITNADGVGGNPSFALANDLAAIEGLSSNGLAVRTASDTWTVRSLVAPAAGLTLTNADGVTGNPTLVLVNDLAALEGLSGVGVAVRTAADTWATRTMTGTINQVLVTTGDGVGGNPTFALPQNIHTGATPIFSGLTLSGLTSGSVVFAGAGGLLAQDNTNFFWDSINKRLGIGVAPSQPLTVGGNIFINAATANLYLKDTSTGWQAANSTVITPLTGNAVRATNYTSGLVGWNVNALGDAEFNNVDVRGAIHASIFTYNAIAATAGTLGVFKSAAKLKSDATVPASPIYGTTTMTVDVVDAEGLSHASSQLFAVNDILRLKDGLVGDTWLKVSSVSDQTAFFRYTCVIMAGTASATYRAGLGVADYGQPGNGFIIQTADQVNAPYLQMATHAAGFTANNSSGTLVVTPQLRLGNLNGSYGYAADTYGFGTGQYGAISKSWLTVEQTNGIRIGNNTATLAQWDTSGVITIGQVTAGQDNIVISAGAISIRNNTTARIQLNADGSGYLANSLISWDTAGNLVVSGNATIAGWTVNSAYLAKDTGTNATSAGLAPTDYPFYAGSTYANRAIAPFRVTPAGALTATSGIIGGWTITATSFNGTNIYLLPTSSNGAILIGTGSLAYNTTNTSFYVDGNGYFSLKQKLTFDGTTLTINGGGTFSGALSAATGTFAGSLTAASGNITGTLAISSVGGALAIGATPPTSATVGTGIWLDRTGLFTLKTSAQTFALDAATGVLKVGSNLASAATTALVVAGSAITYNGESLNPGDLLIGSNASGNTSLRWNRAAGSLEFRLGTTVQITMDTFGTLHGPSNGAGGYIWGLGAYINVDQGAIGTNSTDGVALTNTNTGSNQFSPRIRFKGNNYFGSTNSAIDFIGEMRSSGTLIHAESRLAWAYSLNNNPTYTEAMALTAQGRLGIGTGYPAAILHINLNNTDITNTGGAGSHLTMTNPNATGQNVVSSVINGTVVAKWRTDYVGNISWVAGSTGAHDFYTGGDYPTGTSRLHIHNDGKVGIGTGTPGYALDVNGTIHYTTLTASSDLRLKKRITPLVGVVGLLQQIQPVRFEWNERINSVRSGYELHKPQIGLLAQEVQRVLPELVTSWALDAMMPDALSVSYERLVPVLVQAIREQQSTIDGLQGRIQTLERSKIMSRAVEGTASDNHDRTS